MIVNGKQLLAASPIVGMLTGKEKAGGVTYGLAEVGYDVRIPALNMESWLPESAKHCV